MVRGIMGVEEELAWASPWVRTWLAARVTIRMITEREQGHLLGDIGCSRGAGEFVELCASVAVGEEMPMSQANRSQLIGVVFPFPEDKLHEKMEMSCDRNLDPHDFENHFGKHTGLELNPQLELNNPRGRGV